MLVLAGLGALALASRWSPAARWMMGAVGLLAGIVALLALIAVLLRVLLVAALAAACGLAATATLWVPAGVVLAVVGGGVTFVLTFFVGIAYLFGRWI